MDTSLLSPILTAIVGYVTIRNNRKSNRRNNLMSQKLKEKELNANIISNARIEWLEQVRKHTADHIENTNLLCYTLISGYRDDRLTEALSDYRKSYFMMRLYFSERDLRNKVNRNHEKIINALNNIDDEMLLQMENVVEKDEKFKPGWLEELIEVFCDICAKYFKKVWEEAKDIENAR